MRVDVTVRRPDAELDVALIAPRGTPIRALRRGLTKATGLPADEELSVDGVSLSDDSLIGDDVRPGAVITASASSLIGAAVLRELHIVSGPDAGTIHPLSAGTGVIGRDSDCTVRLRDPNVSRRHAELTVGPMSVWIRDLSSTNGTTIDGRPVTTGTLAAHSYLRVGDSVLAVHPTGWSSNPPSAVSSVGSVIDRPAAPVAIRRPPQWMSIVVPLFGGVLFAVLLHNPQFLIFAMLSPVVMAGTLLTDHRYSRRHHRRDLADHAEDIERLDAEIESILHNETASARARHPNPADLSRALESVSQWTASYRATDEAAFTLRLGLADRPSHLQVRDGGAASRPAGTLSLTPVCIDLRNGPVGIVGPRPLRLAIARMLVVQLAARIAPDELRIAPPSHPSVRHEWHWTRWLPHVSDRGDAPHELLVVDDSDPACPTEDASAALYLADSAERLPQRCALVIGPAGTDGTRVHVTGKDHVADVIADLPDATWIEAAARRLAAVAPPARGRGLPRSCRFSDLPSLRMTPAAIADAWSASDGSASTPLGIGASHPIVIDLARDGPHALVAGTTGSGKSELLQTLVTGLAAGYPPDELSFVLVDYKGGAAFSQCASLPHVCGLLTDLGAADTARALASLNAEIVRRERAFARIGARDLETFRTIEGRALARLVLVVDEFATLIDELPDFVAGLVDVARRGRSLGIHLVLATQRPGGVVSPEIRANTSLRIALRTADDIESIDVIGTAAAAAIPPTTPGRAIVRTGTGTVDVQVACVSAPPPDAAARVELLGHWRSLPRRERVADDTELSLLVSAIIDAAHNTDRTAASAPWLPPLPDVLAPWPTDATHIPFALVDSPTEQRQERIELDLARGGGVVIAGAAGSGRTSTLAGVAIRAAQRLGPDQLGIHLVDAGSRGLDPVKAMPHCESTVDITDLAGVVRLVERLQATANAGHHRAESSAQGAKRNLVLIDGWDALAAGSDAFDVGRTADAVLRLVRAASSGQLLALVTGDRNALYPRVTSAASEVVILRLHEALDYALAGFSSRSVPVRMPPGRGLRRDGRVMQLVAPPEIQIALPASSGEPMCG